MVKHILTTTAGLNKAYGSLAGRGQKLKDEAQVIAIGTMVFMDTHGNYKDSAVKLFEAIETAFGKNQRRTMEEYFLAYTWLAYDPKHKDKNGNAEPWFKDASKSMKLAEAESPMLDDDGNPLMKGKEQVTRKWYMQEKAPSATPFDAQKALAALWTRVLANGKAEDAISAMEKTIADYRANETKLDAESLKSEVSPEASSKLSPKKTKSRKTETAAIA